MCHDDVQILDGDLLVTHLTGTDLTLHDAGRIDNAHGTGMTMDRATAVGHGSTASAMALNDTLVTVTLADAGDVDELALGEDVGGQDIAHVVLRAILQSELLQDLLQLLNAGLLLMADLGLGQVLLLSVLETQLNGLIAILLGGLLLHDGAGTGLNQGDGHHTAGLIEDLGHADLLTDDRFLHFHFWIFLLKGYWLGELAHLPPIGLGHHLLLGQHDPSTSNNAVDCGTNEFG